MEFRGLKQLEEDFGPIGDFTPYCEVSDEADAITVYFKPAADYSKRLTDHVTLHLSMENDQIVGCRIKGVKGLIENLPNFLKVSHGDHELRLVFLACWMGADDEAKQEIQVLGQLANVTGLTCIAA